MCSQRNIFLILLMLGLSGVTMAQGNLPDALQGNPLEDKMIGGKPDSPFGPIHFFPLDGTIVDQITGATPADHQRITRAEGYFGSAVYFDGTGYASLPVDVGIEAMPNFNIVAMVKPGVLPDDPDLIELIPKSGYIFGDGIWGLVCLTSQDKLNPIFRAYSEGANIVNANHLALRNGWQMVALARKIEKRPNDEGQPVDHTILTLFNNGRATEMVAVHKDRG